MSSIEWDVAVDLQPRISYGQWPLIKSNECNSFNLRVIHTGFKYLNPAGAAIFIQVLVS